MTLAVVVHGASCSQGMGDIIAAARSMKLGGSRRLLGARWLVISREDYGKSLAR